MAILLSKGQGVSLSKTNPGLAEVSLGLGWDVQSNNNVDSDLDAFAFLLGSNEKLISDSHLVFYNNLTSPDPNQSVQHMGDNSTGEGEGDDEVIKVNLKKVPSDVKKIVFAVTIFDAEERKQNFGQVKNAFVRLVNDQTQEEVLRYNLGDTSSTSTAMIMAELYRQDGGWTMQAVGKGYKGGAQELIDSYTRQQAINWRYRAPQANR